jgi:hypothetical protein
MTPAWALRFLEPAFADALGQGFLYGHPFGMDPEAKRSAGPAPVGPVPVTTTTVEEDPEPAPVVLRSVATAEEMSDVAS